VAQWVTMKPEPRWERIPEAAKHYRVHERYIRRLVAERRIPFHRFGKFILLDLNELDEIIAASRQDAVR
jgi:excisionase family DNA binding protein